MGNVFFPPKANPPWHYGANNNAGDVFAPAPPPPPVSQKRKWVEDSPRVPSQRNEPSPQMTAYASWTVVRPSSSQEAKKEDPSPKVTRLTKKTFLDRPYSSSQLLAPSGQIFGLWRIFRQTYRQIPQGKAPSPIQGRIHFLPPPGINSVQRARTSSKRGPEGGS
jgi:hypothetical protein